MWLQKLINVRGECLNWHWTLQKHMHRSFHGHFNMASNVPKARSLKKWCAEFKWLEICDNRMYCQICTKWQKRLASCRNYSDAFITKGSNNWQRSALNEHNISAMHSDANDHENRETLGDQFKNMWSIKYRMTILWSSVSHGCQKTSAIR